MELELKVEKERFDNAFLTLAGLKAENSSLKETLNNVNHRNSRSSSHVIRSDLKCLHRLKHVHTSLELTSNEKIRYLEKNLAQSRSDLTNLRSQLDIISKEKRKVDAQINGIKKEREYLKAEVSMSCRCHSKKGS